MRLETNCREFQPVSIILDTREEFDQLKRLTWRTRSRIGTISGRGTPHLRKLWLFCDHLHDLLRRHAQAGGWECD